MNGKAGRVTANLVMGLLIVGVGVLLLLGRFGVVEAEQVLRHWPLGLVAVGILSLLHGQRAAGRMWGAILILAGLAFELEHLGYIRVRFWDLWPLVLIWFGLHMIWRSLTHRKIRERSGEPVSLLNHWAAFGGVQVRSNAQDFQGGEAFAMFGGVDVDLRKAQMQGEEIVIDANALFGGIEMKVPEDWSVYCKGAGILGGYADNTAHPPTAVKRLIVRGYALFGGVEVKN